MSIKIRGNHHFLSFCEGFIEGRVMGHLTFPALDKFQ